MMKVKIELCKIPACQKKMQRFYVREHSTFVAKGWICLECTQIVKD